MFEKEGIHVVAVNVAEKRKRKEVVSLKILRFLLRRDCLHKKGILLL